MSQARLPNENERVRLQDLEKRYVIGFLFEEILSYSLK